MKRIIIVYYSILMLILFGISSCSLKSKAPSSELISVDQNESPNTVDKNINKPFDITYDKIMNSLKDMGYRTDCQNLEQNKSATIVATKEITNKLKSTGAMVTQGASLVLCPPVGALALQQKSIYKDVYSVKIFMSNSSEDTTKLSFLISKNGQPISDPNFIENISNRVNN